MSQEGTIILSIGKNNSHCGITDRLKTAVGLYYVAKVHGLRFKLIHDAGFDLREYLQPNQVDWSCERSDIETWKEEAISFEYYPPFHFPKFTKDHIYLCERYIGKNFIEMSKVPEWQRLWRELFFELFTPTDKVLKALKVQTMPEHYTVINVRFVNSIGMAEETGYNKPFNEEIQTKIIEAVLAKVTECCQEATSPVVIYSDSVRFLKIAEEHGYSVCNTNGVGHIMNPGVSDEVNLGTFVYLFQMAKADKIYSILHLEGLPENSLYKSQYPRYAAIIGNKPFIRL